MVVREIIWTKRASNSFNKTIDYLYNKFGENVTKSFIQRTYLHIERLAKYPMMGKVEIPEKGIRGFVISKHNTVFYRLTDKEIIILNLFSNRRNPKRKSIKTEYEP